MSSADDGTAPSPQGSRLWAFLRTPVSESPILRWFCKPSPKDLVARSELPQPLQLIVLAVLRRVRLWTRERRDVARELIAHFAEGLARGVDEQSLIEEFGDTRQAAKLIRRAKKRNRPLVWQAWRRSWQAIGVLILLTIGLYGFSAARMWLTRPTIAHDYLADVNAPAAAVPPADRAWPDIRNALMAFQFDRSQADTVGSGARPGTDGWLEEVAILEANDEALAQLREATTKPSLGYITGYRLDADDGALQRHFAANPVDVPSDRDPTSDIAEDPGLIGVLLPYLHHLRRASGLFYTDAFRQAQAGHGDRAIADVQAILRLGSLCRETRTLINEMVAIAIWMRGIDAVNHLLHDHPDVLTDESLIELAHQLAMLDGGGTIRTRFDAERLMFQDVLQRVFSDNGSGDGHLTAHGQAYLQQLLRPLTDDWRERDWLVESPATYPVRGLLVASRTAHSDLIDSLLDQAAAEALVPLWERDDSALRNRLERMAGSSVESARYPLIIAMMPAHAKASEVAEKATQRRDAALVVIALELHRRRTGAWPASLGEINSTLLPQVPRDRFDGEPLRYTLIDGRPLLYSVGTDRDDDGGEAPTTHNWSAAMWLPPSELKRRRETPSFHELVPDGDWVLYPPQPEGE